MNIIFLLLPLALILALIFVLLFLWANKRGQFDDLNSPAKRMLIDSTPPPTRASGKDQS